MIGILKFSLTNIDKDILAIDNLNKLTTTSTNSCLFCDYFDYTRMPISIQTNIFSRIDMHHFNDILITDDISQANELMLATSAKKRFLYLYHLEWSYINNLYFQHIFPLFYNDHIELIARSDSHAKLIEQMFKPPKYVMPEWDYKTLIEIDNNE